MTGIALPMVFYGMAQALSLSSLTTAGMARVGPRDVFAGAGSTGSNAHELLADRVSAAFTGATVIALVALAVTALVARTRPTRARPFLGSLLRRRFLAWRRS